MKIEKKERKGKGKKYNTIQRWRSLSTYGVQSLQVFTLLKQKTIQMIKWRRCMQVGTRLREILRQAHCQPIRSCYWSFQMNASTPPLGLPRRASATTKR